MRIILSKTPVEEKLLENGEVGRDSMEDEERE